MVSAMVVSSDAIGLLFRVGLHPKQFGQQALEVRNRSVRYAEREQAAGLLWKRHPHQLQVSLGETRNRREEPNRPIGVRADWVLGVDLRVAALCVDRHLKPP